MSDRTANRHWLRKLVTGQPHLVIGDNYLRRWFLIPRNPYLNIYLHNFQASDDDRALHDHPWWFVSILLRGTYVEHTEGFRLSRVAPSIAFRPAAWRHRVELASRDGRLRPAWTILITGRRTRMWGFWCRNRNGKERFVPFREFGAAGCGETS